MPEVSDLAALAVVIADFHAPEPAALDDAALMDAQRTLAEIGRHVDALAANVAGEIKNRSRRELGYSGLAQRLGARSPEKLVQTLTGSSFREAQTLVRVGELVGTPPADTPPPTPWLVDVAAAVSAGTLSLAAADAIRTGLGIPTDDVSADDLRAAAARLLSSASSLALEQLAGDARNARAELDLDRVRDREAAMRDRRYLRFASQLDGMTRVTGLLDPESAAHIIAAADAALAPRRGPRFLDPESVEAAKKLVADPRSNEQILLDTFVELTRIATAAPGHKILGKQRPVVQIHVTERDLRERSGVGYIDGQLDPVSIETIERYLCDSGTVPIRFDQHGQTLDVGREERTFTPRQRIALAARDGGCRIPNCPCPPSWAEAHHIEPWAEGGNTDIADGILLCRFHHMLIHNNGWRIIREGAADYYLIPPPTEDPMQRPIPMPSKSRALARTRRSTAPPSETERSTPEPESEFTEHQLALVPSGRAASPT
jgi:hypothetical protein